MADRINLCPNPALSATPQSTAGWSGGAGAPAAVSGLSGFPAGITTGAHYTAGSFMTLPIGAASAGLSYTGSVYLRPNGAGIGGGTFYLAFTRSAGGDDFSNFIALGAVASNAVERRSLTATAPANTTGVFIVLDGFNSGSIPGGVHASACLLEQSASLGSYFDGFVPGPPDSDWSGTPGLSTSTLFDSIPATMAITGLVPMQGAAAGVQAVSELAVAGLMPMQSAAALVVVPYEAPPMQWIIGQAPGPWRISQD